MSSEAYNAYLCTRDLPNEESCARHTDCPSPRKRRRRRRRSPRPLRRPPCVPATSDCAVPPRDPSEPTGPLAWTQASLKEDWPAPVRPEPAGGGERPADASHLHRSYRATTDPMPSPASTSADVDTSEVTSSRYLELSRSSRRTVDPTEQWIAYGVVTDDDGDGVPDWRYGIDNLPARRADDERPPPRVADGPPYRPDGAAQDRDDCLEERRRLHPGFPPRRPTGSGRCQVPVRRRPLETTRGTKDGASSWTCPSTRGRP